MSILYVTLGISGSGKSTAIQAYQNSRTAVGMKPAVVISPDRIRKELTGSISDQSKNNEVFRLAYERLGEALAQSPLIIFDSTALGSDTRRRLISIAHEHNDDAVLWVLMDSKDPELCRNRVIFDMKNGVDRADAQRQDIIDRMAQSFKSALNSIPSEGWDDIRYI